MYIASCIIFGLLFFVCRSHMGNWNLMGFLFSALMSNTTIQVREHQLGRNVWFLHGQQHQIPNWNHRTRQQLLMPTWTSTPFLTWQQLLILRWTATSDFDEMDSNFWFWDGQQLPIPTWTATYDSYMDSNVWLLHEHMDSNRLICTRTATLDSYMESYVWFLHGEPYNLIPTWTIFITVKQLIFVTYCSKEKLSQWEETFVRRWLPQSSQIFTIKTPVLHEIVCFKLHL